MHFGVRVGLQMKEEVIVNANHRTRLPIVVDGQSLVKAGLRPPPLAASALTRLWPSTFRLPRDRRGGVGLASSPTPLPTPNGEEPLFGAFYVCSSHERSALTGDRGRSGCLFDLTQNRQAVEFLYSRTSAEHGVGKDFADVYGGWQKRLLRAVRDARTWVIGKPIFGVWSVWMTNLGI